MCLILFRKILLYHFAILGIHKFSYNLINKTRVPSFSISDSAFL